MICFVLLIYVIADLKLLELFRFLLFRWALFVVGESSNKFRVTPWRSTDIGNRFVKFTQVFHLSAI